ncbi:MAG: hypothetical protein KAY24_17365 [Candidatus Eisenbacteria sp.]|nr:hypothetical protein [Candidatus Eisenbacteria bacterium]
MDESPTLWEGLRRRASALRRRYGDIPGGPEDTRSLVSRAAVKFPRGGGLPTAENRDHLYALWTKALCSVLNDLHRRQKTRETHGYKTAVPLEDHHLQTDERDAETLRHMSWALQELARIDDETGESKARILTLRYLDGFTWKEIASELGSSIGTVRREAQFAIAWMRNQLIQRGVPIDESP